MNHTNFSRFSCITLLGVVGLAAIAGCKSNKDYYSYNAIIDDLTPELQGVSERPVDIKTNMAVAENVNLRLFWGDLGRVWFVDRPSILSPFPTVSTSGQPH